MGDSAAGQCQRCGNRLTDDARFCPACGAALIEDPEPRASDASLAAAATSRRPTSAPTQPPIGSVSSATSPQSRAVPANRAEALAQAKRLAGRFSHTDHELEQLIPTLQNGETPLAVVVGEQPSLVGELRRMQVPLFRRRSVFLATDRRLLFTEPVVPASVGEQVPPRVHAFTWSELRITPDAHKVLNRGASTYLKIGFFTTYKINWGLTVTTPAGTYEFSKLGRAHRLRTVVDQYLSVHPEIPPGEHLERPPSVKGLIAAGPLTLLPIIVGVVLASALVIGLVVILRTVF